MRVFGAGKVSQYGRYATSAPLLNTSAESKTLVWITTRGGRDGERVATLFCANSAFLFARPGHRPGDVLLLDAEPGEFFLHRFQAAELDRRKHDALALRPHAVIVRTHLFNYGLGQGQLVLGGQFCEHWCISGIPYFLTTRLQAMFTAGM